MRKRLTRSRDEDRVPGLLRLFEVSAPELGVDRVQGRVVLDPLFVKSDATIELPPPRVRGRCRNVGYLRGRGRGRSRGRRKETNESEGGRSF